MINVYPYETLGHASHGWLDARHHFSFSVYWNPKRTGFGELIVINDDKVAAGKGFGTHPHDNMEIITYVRKGAITHKDSLGNSGRPAAGDVQVMSAGTGVFHSEYNHESEDTTLYQIWIKPDKRNVEPRWEAREFPKIPSRAMLTPLASGRAEHTELGAAFIHQDAAIFGGNLVAGTTITQGVKHQAYVLVSRGEIIVNGVKLKQGDGAEITDEHALAIEAVTDAELLVIDVPAVAKC